MRGEFLSTAKYFFELLRYSVGETQFSGGKVPEKPEDVEWKNIFGLAEMHYLSALLWNAVRGLEAPPEKEIADAWSFAYLNAINLDVQQQFAWEELKSELAGKGMRLMAIKGTQLKKLYPDPALRVMSDMDIVYEKEKFPALKDVLIGLGYEFDKKTLENKHQIFHRQPVMLEMHREMIDEVLTYSEYYKDVWSFGEVTAEENVWKLTNENEYVFLVLHARKHYKWKGNGVRTLADLWLFLKAYESTLDWEKVYSEIAKADTQAVELGNADGISLADYEKLLRKEVQNVFATSEIELDEELLEMLSDGVYGRIEKQWANEVRKKGKFRYLMRRLFPSYKAMKQAYPVVGKCPILLPFVWVFRWFKGLFRGKQIKREMDCINQANKEKKE